MSSVCGCVWVCVCLRARAWSGTQLLSRTQLFAAPWASSLLGSSVHGIFQAGILEWVALSSSRRSSWRRDWTLISLVSCIGRHLLYHCTTWDAPGILEEPKKKKKELRPSLQADAFIEEKIRVRNLRGMCGALREPRLTWLVSRTFLCLMT